MRICYFGQYDPNYSRNSIIRKGLTSLGNEVITCQVNPKIWQPFPKYGKLLRQFVSIAKSVQAIIVAEFNQPVMFLAKALAGSYGLPIIFDPLISRYDTYVYDRQRVVLDSREARYLYWTDRIAMTFATHVLADTMQHSLYYSNKFKIKRPISIVPVGSNDQIFYPGTDEERSISNKLQVIFWGTFIPLQGIQYILKAARILQNRRELIYIKIVGTGQTFPEMKKIAEELELKNVTFLAPVPQDQLPAYIRQSDLVLGIFGDTQKATRVVPNKVYQGLAMAKPIITGDSPAIHEFLVPDRHLFTVPMANPEALAEAIVKLAHDKENCQYLAQQGYQHYLANFTPEQVAKKVDDVLRQLV